MKHYFEDPSEIIITKSFLITHYEISNILLNPTISAIVQVVFYDNTNKRYDRSFLLIDTEDRKDYSDWQTDDYLYSFINKNFLKIFDN